MCASSFASRVHDALLLCMLVLQLFSSLCQCVCLSVSAVSARGVINVSSVVSCASSLDHKPNCAPPWRMQLSGSYLDL